MTAGAYLPSLQLPLAAEARLLVVITFGATFMGNELIRHIPPLRPFFGLKLRPQAAKRPPRAA